jgi:hypothetical protein
LYLNYLSCSKLGLTIEIWYSIGIGYWYCSAVFVQYSIRYSIDTSWHKTYRKNLRYLFCSNGFVVHIILLRTSTVYTRLYSCINPVFMTKMAPDIYRWGHYRWYDKDLTIIFIHWIGPIYRFPKYLRCRGAVPYLISYCLVITIIKYFSYLILLCLAYSALNIKQLPAKFARKA